MKVPKRVPPGHQKLQDHPGQLLSLLTAGLIRHTSAFRELNKNSMNEIPVSFTKIT